MHQKKLLSVLFLILINLNYTIAQSDSIPFLRPQLPDNVSFAEALEPMSPTSEALLMYEGLTCNRNYYILDAMTIYAVCRLPKQGYTLKKTTANYYKKERAVNAIGIKCTDSDSTLFLIGSTKPMKEGVLNGRIFDWTTGAIDYGKLDVPNTDYTLAVDTDDAENHAEWQEAALILIQKSSKKQQVLIRVQRATSPLRDSVFTPPYTLRWCGDIDRDGRPDFIISGESAFAAEERLFLSSYSRPGELVHEVAKWSYCLR